MVESAAACRELFTICTWRSLAVMTITLNTDLARVFTGNGQHVGVSRISRPSGIACAQA